MQARLLDGKALALALRSDLAVRVERVRQSGTRPGLAVVLVGEDPASQLYVSNKVRACEAAGIVSRLERLPATVPEDVVLATVQRLNADPTIHGILVQMPLPSQVDATRVVETIAIGKDVDGFHLLSAGALLTGRLAGIGFPPCTPAGVMRMLESAGVPFAGARAVVIGRSNTVGKPMALMLLAKNATVTICHSATRDLTAVTREADILIAAVGRTHTVTIDMVKRGAAVVDVGINRDADGKLVGDVDFEAVREVAGWISPVPGGVGPMTIAMLLENTVVAAERAAWGHDPERMQP